MKDYFGTVIEPGDAVVVARGYASMSKGPVAAHLDLYTVGLAKDGSMQLIDETGKARKFGFSAEDTVSMKSIARKD